MDGAPQAVVSQAVFIRCRHRPRGHRSSAERARSLAQGEAMSIASRAPQSHASQLHGVLAADGSRPLLVAANVVGALCILTSIFGWGGLRRPLAARQPGFEMLIVLATALFFRSALAQPGRWRRPWLSSRRPLAALVGSLTRRLRSSSGPCPPLLADVFFLSFYPLVIAGLLQFPRAMTTRAEAIGFALDAVAVLFGCGMIDRPLPHHPDAAVDQRQTAGAARLGGLPAGRRAAVLRPRVAGRPPPVPAQDGSSLRSPPHS